MIILEQTIKAVEEIVKGKEDFIYQQQEVMIPYEKNGITKYDHKLKCVYSDRYGKPSCIIGFLLDSFYLKRPVWGSIENYMIAGDVLKIVEDNFDFSAKNFLRQLQNHQDQGDSWGESLKRSLLSSPPPI
jgi:hypothetical protein